MLALLQPFCIRILVMQKAMYRKILVIAVFLACAIALGAQMQDRYALVIGNGSYAELGELKNARNDATDMAAALKDLGFEVTSLIDADLIAMENAVSRFSRQLSTSPNTMGLFYFAGHGVQSNGINYLIPTDARIPEESYLKLRALAVQAIFEDLQNAKNRLNIIILDACRDNPFSWARSGTRGLSVVSSQPPGSIIVYATSAGSTALEGTGRNGVFTGELLKHLKTSGIDVMEVFNRTGAAVQQATNGKQNPAIYTQFFDKAYFIGAAEVSASPYTSPPSPVPSQAAGKTPSMVVQKNYGSIAATVQTSGTLLLDGMVMGTVMPNATALLNDVEAGLHEIRMEYASGNVEIKTVEVKKNQQAQVSFERKPFTVRYDSNGATAGTVPVDSATYAPGDLVTVLGNIGSLEKKGYRFVGWNTKADGTGTSYPPGSSFSMGMENATLYAEWNTSMIAAVAAGGFHTMILKTDGTFWATGWNFYGQLGDGTTMSRSTPVRVMSGVQAVAAGGYHTMILKTDGTLWATGWNFYGQLGDGTFTDRSTPMRVMSGVQAVAAGDFHTMILKTDGTLWATGWNDYGQLGDGTFTERSTPVRVMSGVQAVAAGVAHTMILKIDGTLWATGRNDYGQLCDGTTTNRITPVQVMDSVQAVAAGVAHTIILKTDGTLWATGRNDYGQLGDGTTTSRSRPVQVMRDVQAVAAGDFHTMILKTDGTLWATGWNDYGQLGDGTFTERSTPVRVMSGVQAVAAGVAHTMILKIDGTLWATGRNDYGQLCDGTTTNRITPVQVMDSVQAVAAGVAHTIILKTDGTLWATGRNDYGQLGDGTTTSRSRPVQVMRDVQAVAAGDFHTMILKTDGTLWATGRNDYGQLGDGTTTNRSTPVRVMSGVQTVSAGASHTMILKTDGTLCAVGHNYSGQLGDGTTMSRSMPVQISF